MDHFRQETPEEERVALRAAAEAYRDAEIRTMQTEGIRDRYRAMLEGKPWRETECQDMRIDIASKIEDRTRVGVEWAFIDVYNEKQAARDCFMISYVETGDAHAAYQHTLRRMCLKGTMEEFFAPEEPAAAPAP